jgi:hypothetical protein
VLRDQFRAAPQPSVPRVGQSRLWACAILAACMMSGLSTPAQSTQSTTPMAGRTPSESPGQALRARASALRRNGPSSWKEPTLAPLSTSEQGAAQSLIAGLGKTDAWLLRRSIRQSRQYVVVHGKRGYTGWVNPFTGTWVVGIWNRTGTQWRLDGLYPALATEFGKTSNDKPGLNAGWIAPSKRPAEALVDAEREAVAAFKEDARSAALAQAARDSAGAERARKVMIARQAALLLGLNQAHDRPGYHDYSVALAQLFGNAKNPDASVAALQHQVAGIPDAARNSLEPVMAIDQSNGLTFVTQSPQAPGVVVFVHFAPDPAGHPQPVRVRMALLFSQRSL